MSEWWLAIGFVVAIAFAPIIATLLGWWWAWIDEFLVRPYNRRMNRRKPR